MTLVTDYEPNDQPAAGDERGERDPRRHTANIKRMLTEAQQHAREDVPKVDDPQARALFEVTAEVLGGLLKAYSDYETRAEAAWQPGPGAPR